MKCKSLDDYEQLAQYIKMGMNTRPIRWIGFDDKAVVLHKLNHSKYLVTSFDHMSIRSSIRR
jgi:hypothetical protein